MKKKSTEIHKSQKIFSIKMKNLDSVLALFKKFTNGTASAFEIKKMETIGLTYLPFTYSPHGGSFKNMFKHIGFTLTGKKLKMKFSEQSEFNKLLNIDDYFMTYCENIPLSSLPSELNELAFYQHLLYNIFIHSKFIKQVHQETGFPVHTIIACFKEFFDDLHKETLVNIGHFLAKIKESAKEVNLSESPSSNSFEVSIDSHK